MDRIKDKISFGTDGWRGIIADTYTIENVEIVSQAVADYLGPGKKVAIGFDSRFMSERFALAAANIISHNGIKVLLSDRIIPTPTLSFTVKNKKCDLGIMITASHNPFIYNGFKIKVASGGAADIALTKKIERLLYKNPPRRKGAGDIKVENFVKDYCRFVRSYIDLGKIRQHRFRVAVDAMYGSGDSFIADILIGTKIKLDFLRNTFNPGFDRIAPEPIEKNLTPLILKLKKEDFDLGIALDGDADRIAGVAAGGVFIHPQKILGLLILHLHQDRGWSGGVVKTVCGTNLINNITRRLGLPLYETPVGFKYISDLMVNKDILAGGEEAGGIGVKNYIPERDGTMVGLLLLEMMAYRKKNIIVILNEMEREFGRYYYLRESVELKEKIKIEGKKIPLFLDGKKVVEVNRLDGLKFICEDESWLMVRASGTEPIVRLYAEAKELQRAKELIAIGRRFIAKA